MGKKRKLSLNYTHHPFLLGVLNVVILFILLARAHIEASEFGSLVFLRYADTTITTISSCIGTL